MLRLHINLLNLQLRRFSSSRPFRKALEEAQEKSIKVAIIGLPNSGKSTLINSILDHRVCATSDKVHTTTDSTRVVTNRHQSQIIVYDTPGLVTPKEMKKHQLSQNFITSCHKSIKNSEMIGVLHDVSNHFTRGAIDPIIIELLKQYQHIPSILILNKIDKMRSKRTLLDLVKSLTNNNISLDKKRGKSRALEEVVDKPVHKDKEWEKKTEVGWPEFKAVFMVSSLNGDGVEKVMNFVESNTVERSWEFKKGEVTDQTPEKLIEEFVRARLLDYLPQEIPYLLKVKLEYFTRENNKIFASVIVTCANERHEKLVCGVSDGKLRQITDRVTSDLIQHFQQGVSLTLSTVVSRNPQQ